MVGSLKSWLDNKISCVDDKASLDDLKAPIDVETSLCRGKVLATFNGLYNRYKRWKFIPFVPKNQLWKQMGPGRNFENGLRVRKINAKFELRCATRLVHRVPPISKPPRASICCVEPSINEARIPVIQWQYPCTPGTA